MYSNRSFRLESFQKVPMHRSNCKYEVLVLSDVTYEVVCSYSYSNKGKKEVGGKFRLEIVK